MRIEIVKQKFEGHVSYKYKPFKHCCKKMKQSKMTRLSNEWDDYTCIKMCLRESYVEYDYEDTWDIENFYPINFCPFCGEQIEIQVVKTENLTDKYNNLNYKRDSLNQERRVTDSKLREYELSKIIREIDNEIQSMYDLEEYQEENKGE